MTPKKATSVNVGDEEVSTTPPSLEELQNKIKQLEDEIAKRDEVVDQLQKRDEGYLIWSNNPAYEDKTCGIKFTDGMAFIPDTREIPNFPTLPIMTSAKRFCEYLKNDYNYQYEFFDRSRLDELNKRMSDRMKERRELEARVGTTSDMLEKLISVHTFKKE